MTHPALLRSLLVAALLGALVAAPAHAERADRNQPLNFAADALRYDDARQTNVLTGNVVITKGTMTLRAGQVEVKQTPDGHQVAVALAAKGRAAFFRQKREGLDEYIEGEAQRIEYDSRADTLRMKGDAVLRRYRGNTLADEVAGQAITFDNGADLFSVAGGAAGSQDGRVRGVLGPRSTAPAASAPGASR